MQPEAFQPAHFGFVPLADQCTAIYKVNGNLPDQLVGGRPILEHKGPSAFDEFPRTVAWPQQVWQACPSSGGCRMIVDLESWEAGYGDGYLAARLNARPVSTASRIRAAISRLARVVQGRRKTFGCATLGRHGSSSRLIII